MPKEEPIRTEGRIVEALPNTQFMVELENGHRILAHIAGKMAKISSASCPATASLSKSLRTTFPRVVLYTASVKLPSRPSRTKLCLDRQPYLMRHQCAGSFPCAAAMASISRRNRRASLG